MFVRILVVTAVLVSVIWSATTYLNAATGDQTEISSQISELMKERHKVLRKRLDAVQAMHAAGSVSTDRVIAANESLLNAELELAANQSERIEICKKRIENLRQLERILAERYTQGSVSIEVSLMATAARLQAEIDCLREQSQEQN